MESVDSKKKANAVSVVIDAAPERVFAILTDVGNHTDWARGPGEIRNLSENPAQMGTTWQQISKVMGRSLIAECQVNIYEEDQRFGFAGDKPFPFQFMFDLAPNGGGTRLSMRGEFEPEGFFKIARSALNSTLESQMKADLLTLKGLLEAE